MRLKFGVEFIFAAFLGFVAFKEDYATSLVSCSEVISRMIEFDRRCSVILLLAGMGCDTKNDERTDDIGFSDILYFSLIAVEES